MRTLVTGGAGFIGSHLTERLLEDGNEVVVVDNLSTGSLKNIESFKDKDKFNFVEGDIRNAELMDALVERSETVFHLAAAVGVKLIAERPVHTIETNISGTEVVLDAANKTNKKVFILPAAKSTAKARRSHSMKMTILC